MTSVVIPNASAGDNVLNDRNSFGALVQGALNNLDGANLQAATVPQTALAKGKAVWTQTFSLASNMNAVTNNSVVPGWFMIIPNFDGAAATVTYLGASVGSSTINTSSSSTLAVRSNTNAIHTITLTSMTTNNTPVAFAPGAPQNVTSGKILDVYWTSAGAPTFSNTTITLYFSQPHVAT